MNKYNQFSIIAGWEIVSTTRKHCYWGRKWCQDEVNVGPGSVSFLFMALKYCYLIPVREGVNYE